MHPDSDRLAEIAERLPGALIALDFDGTLAPITRDPDAARPVPGVIDTLARLARAGISTFLVATGFVLPLPPHPATATAIASTVKATGRFRVPINDRPRAGPRRH